MLEDRRGDGLHDGAVGEEVGALELLVEERLVLLELVLGHLNDGFPGVVVLLLVFAREPVLGSGEMWIHTNGVVT